MKLQMKISVPPAKSPGIISGSVIRENRRRRVQPRLAAASSMAGSMLASAATALR